MQEWGIFDTAFAQLLEYYGQALLMHARFLPVDCDRSEFLCGIWSVKEPSIVHLSVNLDGAYFYRRDTVRVQIKIVELPLTDWTPNTEFLPLHLSN